MHKTSVTFPAFDWQRDGVAVDDMACKGLTARMHQKFMGGDEGRSQSRRKESSLMPPITPRKLSASSQSSSLTKDQDGSVKKKYRESEDTKMPNFDVHEETGYLEIENLSNRSMAEKISNKGHKLYTLNETKKLPEILKPKGKSTDHSTRKRKGQKQGKKPNIDGNSTWSGLQDAAIPTIVTGEESQLRPDSFSEWKYIEDWKRRLEWSITRPFTFSYFPKIHQKRKKKDPETANNRAKKTGGKGVVTPHLNK